MFADLDFGGLGGIALSEILGIMNTLWDNLVYLYHAIIDEFLD